MKKLIIAAVSILVLGGITYTGTANKSNTQTANSSPQQTQPAPKQPEKPAEQVLSGTVTVTYEESGFTPASLTIAKGTTINFINKTQIPLWVASDPHPDHTDYPGFDVAAQGSVPEPGQDTSFTFEKIGTWRYHNHSAPEDKASVTVK